MNSKKNSSTAAHTYADSSRRNKKKNKNLAHRATLRGYIRSAAFANGVRKVFVRGWCYYNVDKRTRKNSVGQCLPVWPTVQLD